MSEPRWTIDENGDLVCTFSDGYWVTLHDLHDPDESYNRAVKAIAALVAAVRDADTLRQARELFKSNAIDSVLTRDSDAACALLDLLAPVADNGEKTPTRERVGMFLEVDYGSKEITA